MEEEYLVDMNNYSDLFLIEHRNPIGRLLNYQSGLVVIGRLVTSSLVVDCCDEQSFDLKQLELANKQLVATRVDCDEIENYATINWAMMVAGENFYNKY